jgi:hypothetical protein
MYFGGLGAITVMVEGPKLIYVQIILSNTMHKNFDGSGVGVLV